MSINDAEPNTLSEAEEADKKIEANKTPKEREEEQLVRLAEEKKLAEMVALFTEAVNSAHPAILAKICAEYSPISDYDRYRSLLLADEVETIAKDMSPTISEEQAKTLKRGRDFILKVMLPDAAEEGIPSVDLLFYAFAKAPADERRTQEEGPNFD